MPATAWRSALQSSHAYAGISNPVNRYAAAITLGVALAVAAYARVPLAGEFSVDFRGPLGFGLARQATLVGFSNASRDGRAATTPEASVIMNRPLPASFVLEIDGQATGPSARDVIDVAVGDATYRLRFDETTGVQAIAIRNPSHARTIAFRAAARPGSTPGIRIRRLTVR